jgi:hypothetical protein
MNPVFRWAGIVREAKVKLKRTVEPKKEEDEAGGELCLFCKNCYHFDMDVQSAVHYIKEMVYD